MIVIVMKLNNNFMKKIYGNNLQTNDVFQKWEDSLATIKVRFGYLFIF